MAQWASRISGLPGWAALPAGVAAGSLLVALLGMYWDISLHIDDGRDEGPLANPAHYLILFGLFGIFAAGVLAIALPPRASSPVPRPCGSSRAGTRPVGGAPDRRLRRLRAASASRSTTCGTGCSARTSRSGARRT